MALYKTVYTIEVLSDEPLDNITLGDIEYEITEGHCSGVFREKSREELTEFQMAKALIRQGSDPEFLLPEWVQCPYCEGTGKDIIHDQEPMSQGGRCREVVLECYRCQGVGMMSPESLAAYKEVDDARTDA